MNLNSGRDVHSLPLLAIEFPCSPGADAAAVHMLAMCLGRRVFEQRGDVGSRGRGFGPLLPRVSRLFERKHLPKLLRGYAFQAIPDLIKRKVTAHQIPVYLRGATTDFVIIRPGDFLLGDEDGLLVIPVECIDEILSKAEELTQKEARIRAEIAKGLSLADALEKYGHV